MSEAVKESYVPIRVLGRGAFGEAVLYRKVLVRFTSALIIVEHDSRIIH